MRRTLVAIILLAGLVGCSGGKPAPEPATPTYPPLPRPVRFGEVPVDAPTVRDGQLQFTVIGLTSDISSIVGSHAEWFPHGRYVAVRLVLENVARIQQNFVARRQQLLTADGHAYQADYDAANIKRQPWEQLVGSEVRIEFDLYFDIPKDAKVVAARFFADPPGPGAKVSLPSK